MNTRITTSTPKDLAPYITILRMHRLAEKHNSSVLWRAHNIIELHISNFTTSFYLTYHIDSNTLEVEMVKTFFSKFHTLPTSTTYNTFGALNDAINSLCDDDE